ncbi:hypothetical protein FKW77_004743 [Venturia effusa]|uniref:F-box domain-containing protein n=1 Tax=Venturia effusa TaxID=50376 RepID=A0A517LFD7_9PEZI|nr:hypothetical protein FKW77_004743 [Venturia effusa]
MAFNKLAIETNQSIAIYLSDKDIANFRLVCRVANYAIDADYNRFWSDLWKQQYDLPRVAHRDHTQTKREYQSRRETMPKTRFNGGLTRKEKLYLKTIKAIIIDADPVVDSSHQPTSRNIAALEHFVKETNLMEVIFSRAPKAIRNPKSKPKVDDQLLPLIQLVLSALSLRLEHGTVWSFDTSQRMCYMSSVAEPLFGGPGGTDVNVDWALHAVNFFRYHALRSEEATLHGPWKNLTKDNMGLGLPQLMKERLNNQNATIGHEWKGTYAYLLRHEVQKLRKQILGQGDYYQDKNIEAGEGAIQRLTLDFPSDAGSKWPKVFEKHLESLAFHHDRLGGHYPPPIGAPAPPTARMRRNRPASSATLGTSLQFQGEGYDDENFCCAGWINPLPSQNGIPGWKRMTMMKFFKNEQGLIDRDALWAYEGVVLPGDQIVVGRWWSPEGLDAESKLNQYSGPFILWNVDQLEAYKGEKLAAEQIETLGVAM